MKQKRISILSAICTVLTLIMALAWLSPERRAVFLFESNWLRPYSTHRIRQIVHQYASAAGIQKRVYPHLFRHQIITFLTRKGIISPKLQLLSGHAEENSLAIYRDLALADVSDEYEQAMRTFPAYWVLSQLALCRPS